MKWNIKKCCPICESVEWHLVTHLGENKFYCEKCESIYNQRKARDIEIVIDVDGGIVQAVYATGAVSVAIMDRDNLDDEARAETIAELNRVEKNERFRCVY